MFILLYIVFGIITVSLITYLIIRFCFETRSVSSYPRMARLRHHAEVSPGNNTNNVTCPVAIIIHSCSSNGNIDYDYDLPPTYTHSVTNSRSNSTNSLPDYHQAVGGRVTTNPLSDQYD
ncbi:hypothetical protein PPYR_02950 [Photinus pyralis]|uniref:Uncharacterized protein n=1 Tax=Photinus pyralis TaxID=7054 RepID=A0A1Y1MFQ6_PHOPY|nr:uncharacterized protein LOC116162441 [Photinus pyralis]KAB0791150.1 hypothetical protein PPYR_02950 [Photinus pyralis]